MAMAVYENFMNVFCDEEVCVSLIHHINMRAVEIIGTEDLKRCKLFFKNSLDIQKHHANMV